MERFIRAIYEDGHIKLLEKIELHEGQQLKISLDPIGDDEKLKSILGDTVRWPDLTDDEDAWVEDMAEEIASALSKGRSLSEIIIEDRNNGW